MLLCKEKPPTRHLERSETKSKDLNYCLFTNNNISGRNHKRTKNYFLLNSKIKLITIRFFDFCNLCIYDTFTFVCNKSVRSLRFIRFTHFGRDDVYGERFVLMLNVNSK